MNKYIPADKVLSEIERLEQENCMSGGEHFCMRRAICLGNLRNIVTSPYHEQTEVDLEKEIKNEIDEYWYDNDYGAIQRHGGTITMEISDVKEIARHFAEWGAIHLNARKEE